VSRRLQSPPRFNKRTAPLSGRRENPLRVFRTPPVDSASCVSVYRCAALVMRGATHSFHLSSVLSRSLSYACRSCFDVMLSSFFCRSPGAPVNDLFYANVRAGGVRLSRRSSPAEPYFLVRAWFQCLDFVRGRFEIAPPRCFYLPTFFVRTPSPRFH